MLSMWAVQKPSAGIFSLNMEVGALLLATMVLNRKYKHPARLYDGDWKNSDKSRCLWHEGKPITFQFLKQSQNNETRV